MRAVIDTNILVRAILKPDGSVGPVVDLLRDGRYVILYSDATLNELIDVLGRPRMVRKYGLTATEVEALSLAVDSEGGEVVARCGSPGGEALPIQGQHAGAGIRHEE